MKRCASLALLLALTLGTGRLYADDSEPPEWTEAAKLLDEGRLLMSRKATLDQGCEVLKKSYSLRKRGDTLLNLAECHRRQGKTATAWREFDEAIRYAKEADYADAVRAAELHRDFLAKKLSELVIQVPLEADRPKAMAVTLDGEPLSELQWGQILYVDPGTHQVTATAPEHHPFSASATVGGSGTRSVVVVKLVPLPRPPPPKPPSPSPSSTPQPTPDTAEPALPVWAIVVGSIGVAMMGTSVGFLVDSLAAGDELDDSCGGERRNACRPGSPYAETYDREVRGFGVFVGLGAGGLIAVGASVTGLALWGAERSSSPVAVLPWADPNGAGAAFVGRF
ncbi:MAG: hypothetical protein JNL21_03315 [Myxococcales bacterium]|nr:hypothetical protein [Myxococcales bacterium]